MGDKRMKNKMRIWDSLMAKTNPDYKVSTKAVGLAKKQL